MSPGTNMKFRLPEGWTIRKVAAALAKEWLPPFRAEPTARSARWVVHSVVEAPADAEAPLWEPGISTEEYEQRMDRSDLCWAIRASAGRGKHTILARLAMSEDQPETFQMQLCQAAYPEALFDSEKMHEFLETQGTSGADDLFSALLVSKGFDELK